MKIDSQKIAVILASKGMSKTQLAAQAGLSKQSVSTILTRGTCTTVSAGKLAKALCVEVVEIIKGE